MSKKPILMNTEMARAVLEDRKTQTRRVNTKICLMNQNKDSYSNNGVVFKDMVGNLYFEHNLINLFSKYKVGDILYIRETFKIDSLSNLDKRLTILFKTGDKLKINEKEHNQVFEKFDKRLNGKWKPSIHMPKEYARIFLKVTNIRIERLQDITYEDILKEGCPYRSIEDALEVKAIGVKSKAFEWWINLWNSTAKDGYKWEDNPLVVVYDFERIEI